jgi:membrane fusion protein, multidrug efflux system
MADAPDNSTSNPSLLSPASTGERTGPALNSHTRTTRFRGRAEKYATAAIVLTVVAVALVSIHTTRRYGREHGVREFTDDACLRGNLTVLNTRIAGIVKDVKVSDFQQVHEGDALLILEDTYFRAQVDQARALLEAAKAALQTNRSRRELQQARLEVALARLDRAKARMLSADTASVVEFIIPDEKRVAPEQNKPSDLDDATTELSSNRLAVETERRTLTMLEVSDARLFAEVMVKKLELMIAEANLSYTKITAPGNGRIAELHVRPGQLVSPGTHVMTFLGNMRWVDANYHRTQISNLRVGDPAEIRIDAYPGHVIRATVQEIGPGSGSQCAPLSSNLASCSDPKAQRVPVKLMLENSDFTRNLRPGLSVTATVRTDR